jgi:hypothetical protein
MFLIFFVFFTAGCIDTGSLNEDLVSDELNKLMPEDAVQEKDLEIPQVTLLKAVKVTKVSPSLRFLNCPHIPKRTQRCLSKRIPLLSQNFRRAIGKDEKIGEELFNIHR